MRGGSSMARRWPVTWGSSRGNTPAGHGSGSGERPNKTVRCCASCGVKPVLMRRVAHPELKRFYRRKLLQKGLGKARVAVARKLGIRLWIMLRDEIDYQEFCRRGERQQK